MISGLLWFDDDPRKGMPAKIGEAAQRYLARFGVAPTVCRTHCPNQQADLPPATAIGLPARVPGLPATVTVIADRRVRPHHFWLGRDEPPGAAARSGDVTPAQAPPMH